jgi:hypothetical protein
MRRRNERKSREHDTLHTVCSMVMAGGMQVSFSVMPTKRTRSWMPLPHDSEHVLHCDQSDTGQKTVVACVAPVPVVPGAAVLAVADVVVAVVVALLSTQS